MIRSSTLQDYNDARILFTEGSKDEQLSEGRRIEQALAAAKASTKCAICILEAEELEGQWDQPTVDMHGGRRL